MEALIIKWSDVISYTSGQENGSSDTYVVSAKLFPGIEPSGRVDGKPTLTLRSLGDTVVVAKNWDVEVEIV